MIEAAGEARVVAVVVAYNRRDLLAEALEALQRQTVRLAKIVVVDNASSDDSSTVAASFGSQIDVVGLARNTGGAGGFAAGIAVALTDHRPDWLWLMDDDTIPSPNALFELLKAVSEGAIVAAGSRVEWVDGREHPMNTPRTKPFAAQGERVAASSRNATPVRTTSFVSMLVRADRVREVGLPVADYFIWNDDFEYSARILRGRRGLHVPSSVVTHKTKVLGASDTDPGPRFYNEVRNKLWLFRFSSALNPLEKCMYGASSIRRWIRAYVRSSDRHTLAEAFRRGLRDGLASKPKANALVLEGLGRASAAIEAVETPR